MITDPTWIFLIVLCIILFAPMLLERLRIPSIVGMIFAGVLIGPHGFGVLERDGSFELFGKVGLYYIMFLASLEMNLQDVQRIKGRALTLGLLSFAIPMLIGYVANSFLLGYGIAASVLIAAMYASHTLIAYPIVLRYGLSRLKSVSIAVGGTIVADTLTLLVLAVVGGMFKEHVTGLYWVWLVVKVILLGAIIIYVFPRVGRWFFRRYNESVVQYVFVLGMVFLGAGLMELVGMEGILGAFLVGLVLNRLIPPSSPLMSHIEFVGNALFIPYFLIGVGMLINLGALIEHEGAILAACVMVVVGLVSKWLASFTTQKVFRMSADERKLMFGLTGSRAAATLAVVLVGYKIILPNGTHLLGEDVLNGAMVLILVTCVVSSLITENTARQMAVHQRVATIAKSTPVADENPDRIMMAPDIRVKMSEVLTGGGTKMEKAETKKATAVIDVYVSDFGALKLVPNRVQAYETFSKTCAFVLDPQYWKVAYLRGFREERLAVTGDSLKGHVLVECTLEARNDASSGVLADLKSA